MKPTRDMDFRTLTEEEAMKVAEVRPWDLIDPRAPRAPEVISDGRLAICRECPAYQPLLRRCSDCGCLMPAKVLLANAACPQGRWMPVEGVPK
jgi:hypothetical protein